MRNMKKLLAAMLALTMIASMTGCSGSEKTASEPSTETKADVAETVGQKANDDMAITEVKEPKNILEYHEGTDYGIEIYNENGLQIMVTHTGTEKVPNFISFIAHTSSTVNEEILEIQDVRIWNESVSYSKSSKEKQDAKYLLKAGKLYQTGFYVNEDALDGKSLSDCDNIVIQAKYGDTSFEMTIPVADVNERNNRGHRSEQEKVLFVEEQEIYNANGLYAIIPEQELKGNGLQISIENKRDSAIAISFMNVLFNEELVYKGSPNGSDMVLNAGEADSEWIYLGDGLETKMLESGTENGNISFTLFFTENQMDALDDPTITVPVTTKTGN